MYMYVCMHVYTYIFCLEWEFKIVLRTVKLLARSGNSPHQVGISLNRTSLELDLSPHYYSVDSPRAMCACLMVSYGGWESSFPQPCPTAILVLRTLEDWMHHVCQSFTLLLILVGLINLRSPWPVTIKWVFTSLWCTDLLQSRICSAGEITALAWLRHGQDYASGVGVKSAVWGVTVPLALPPFLPQGIVPQVQLSSSGC